MINCKQTKIPKIENVDVQKLFNFCKLGNHLFQVRYNHHAWISFDFVTNGTVSQMMLHFPSIVTWYKTILEIGKVKNMYLSVLKPKNQIPWHQDRQDNEFDGSFITALRTDSSFIEFKDDKKYTYRNGYSYLIRSGIQHRIFNYGEDFRLTLCTTLEEKENVFKLVD